MKKTLLFTAALSVLATSVFAENAVRQKFDISAPSLSKSSSTFEDSGKAKKSQKAAPEAQEAEGWGTWAYNKAWDAGKYIAENGARIAAGNLATAYGTPYLSPVVNAAGEVADWGVCGAVTAATGLYPVGWVAGKSAKVATLSAGYSAAPTVAYAAGYYAPEIANGVYNVGNAFYNAATGTYNYFYGS